MSFARRGLVWLSTSIFTVLLFLTIVATAVAVIVTPDNFKGWLKDSGAYTNFVDAAFKSLPHDTSKGEGDDILAQPGVQVAAKNAFPPELLQRSAENFIDGTFIWLEGKNPKPTFAIDLSGAKQAFATGIGNYALRRYTALPLCTPGQVLATDDILSVPCRVQGVDITPAINQKVQEIATGKELLEKPVITPETLESNSGQTSQKPFYETMSELPKAYQLSKVLPYILGGLAVLSAVVIIFASTTKRSGLKRTAVPLIVGAVLLFMSMLVISFGIQKIDEAKITSENAVAALAQSTAVSIGRNAGGQLNMVYLWFAIGFLLVGAGILIALHFTRDKTPKTPIDKPASSKTDDKKETKPLTIPPKPSPGA